MFYAKYKFNFFSFAGTELNRRSGRKGPTKNENFTIEIDSDCRKFSFAQNYSNAQLSIVFIVIVVAADDIYQVGNAARVCLQLAKFAQFQLMSDTNRIDEFFI